MSHGGATAGVALVSRWEKLLRQMRDSPRCVGFTYDEAARVLLALGFQMATANGGSHRRWVLLREGLPPVIIGLVAKGHGELLPVYIKEMLATLEAHGLLPEEPDAVC